MTQQLIEKIEQLEKKWRSKVVEELKCADEQINKAHRREREKVERSHADLIEERKRKILKKVKEFKKKSEKEIQAEELEIKNHYKKAKKMITQAVEQSTAYLVGGNGND